MSNPETLVKVYCAAIITTDNMLGKFGYDKIDDLCKLIISD